MKTTVIKKQYVKPSTEVFEMNANINLLTGSDPQWHNGWGDGQF